jgi:hypothetical protein
LDEAAVLAAFGLLQLKALKLREGLRAVLV